MSIIYAPESETKERARDGFLDVIRAIASIRVVVWHAYGAPLISWFIAAMPAMFFVFGSLLAASCERRSYLAVAVDRIRRVLIPLWAFTAITWAAVALVGHGEASNPLALVSWLFPLLDPRATGWEEGWLSTPLWFMRMIVWLLLLSPLLLPATRRWPQATLGVLVATVFAADWLGRHPQWTPQSQPMLWWLIGDAALYGAFAVLGFWHHRTQFANVTVRRWLLLAGATALAALVWRFTQPVHLGVVNNSHPLHLFVGVAWLSVAFAARLRIAALATHPVTAEIVRFFTRRSMTIYLWHTTVIVCVLWLLRATDVQLGAARPFVYLGLIAAGVYIATLVVGWAEDLAARRRMAVHVVKFPNASRRHRRQALVAVVIIAVLGGTGNLVAATPSPESAHRPPPIPSQQPPPPEFATEDQSEFTFQEVPESELQAWLETELRNWRVEHDASGVHASLVTAGGNTWSATDGTLRDGNTPLTSTDSFDIASITKLMTASLVLRAVDEGRINLDAPLPHLVELPDFPYSDKLTPRMLLSHRSGLVNYRDTTRYAEDSSSVTTPQDAIGVSVHEPLAFEPGTQGNYSSVNYLVLGLLIEQVYNKPYEKVLHEQLLLPLGLNNTVSIPSAPGEPNHSTAGTMTTMDDLTKMTRKLLRDGTLVSPESLATMKALDLETGLGAGVIGFCPCTVDETGNRSFYSLGHYGSDTLVIYVPERDAVVGLRVTDGIHGDRLDHVIDLASRIAR